MRHIRNIFYVSVDFHHDYHFETTQSKSFKEIASGILGDIKDKVDRLLALFDWMSFVTSFFFLFMLIKQVFFNIFTFLQSYQISGAIGQDRSWNS